MASQLEKLDDLRSIAAEEATIRQALVRGVEQVMPERFGHEGLEQLMKDRPITLYLGIDPTSPDLHIGHTVPLRKLEQFRRQGHRVVLLFGTFTGKIGDPTDKTAARRRLTDEDIARNVATYREQAQHVLDIDNADNPVTIVYNDDWLGRMTFAEVVDLMANFTVSQMMERSMFATRVAEGKPVWLHELTYPLMQGWDSVAMSCGPVALSVDLEVGGNDQIFNMLVGRDLVRRYQSREKWVMGMKLIEDPSGKKMGKTEKNVVNVNDWPEWKYEAIMSWPDGVIPRCFELLTSIPLEEVQIIEELMQRGEVNPMQLKMILAYRVIAEIDGEEAADYAEAEYNRVIRQKLEPRRVKETEIPSDTTLDQVLVLTGLAKNTEEALQRLTKGAVYVDGEMIRPSWSTKGSDGFVHTIQIISKDSVIKIGGRTIKNVRQVRVV